LQDVSPHALILSFVSGLSDFLTTLVPPAKKAEELTLWQEIPGTTTIVWLADADYLLQNVACTGASGSNVSITNDNSAYAANVSGSTQKKGAVYAIFGANPTQLYPQNTRINQGQRVTINNASATACGVLLFLVKA
jgi:hypothetical protein